MADLHTRYYIRKVFLATFCSIFVGKGFVLNSVYVQYAGPIPKYVFMSIFVRRIAHHHTQLSFIALEKEKEKDYYLQRL